MSDYPMTEIIWWCVPYERNEDIPNDHKTCHAIRYRKDEKPEDHVDCGLYRLVKVDE